MSEIYDFQNFLEIIEQLRSKDGCPWDREQTHSSLKRCMIEEAYEVVEGIEQFEATGDYRNLREELGDVLLQVVLHSQIAKEAGNFTIKDVVNEISEKMIRRHPHVFKEKQVSNLEEVIKTWEEIKSQEKEEKKIGNGLREVPKAFPALLRAQKVQKKAKKLYSKEELTIEQQFDKINQEIERLKQIQKEAKKDDLQIFDCVGQLFYELAEIAGKMGINAEECLAHTTENRIQDFENN